MLKDRQRKQRLRIWRLLYVQYAGNYRTPCNSVKDSEEENVANRGDGGCVQAKAGNRVCGGANKVECQKRC